tara:strand:+ start:1211 stop:1516 length:306 start_codon:yes stop_codon:yes gene_type:complete
MDIIVKNYSNTKIYNIEENLHVSVEDFKKKIASDFNLDINDIKLQHYNRILENDKIMDHYINDEKEDKEHFIIFINSNSYDIAKINRYLIFGILFMLSTCK